MKTTHINSILLAGVLALGMNTIKAELPYHYDFDTFTGWSQGAWLGTGSTRTTAAVDDQLVVSISRNESTSNGIAGVTAFANNTGADLNFYQTPITMNFNGVTFDPISNSNQFNVRGMLGINSRNNTLFYTSSSPHASIYFVLRNNTIQLAYNLFLGGGNPDNAPLNTGPNVLATFDGAYSAYYENMKLTLNGTSWNASFTFFDELDQSITMTYNGTFPVTESLWGGNGDAFFLTVSTTAQNNGAIESSTLMVDSISIIPEPSAYAYTAAAFVLFVGLLLRRKKLT